jgi:hypothetical protein
MSSHSVLIVSSTSIPTPRALPVFSVYTISIGNQKLVAKFAKAGDKDIKVSRIQLNKRITVPPMSTIQRTVKLENDFQVLFRSFQ